MRTQEREHAHVASMLDNLINLASQDCTRRKLEKNQRRDDSSVPSEPIERLDVYEEPEETRPTQHGASSFEVRLVSLDEEDPTKPVAVTLSIDGVDGTGAAMPQGTDMMGAVADAAARAIERIRPHVAVSITTTVVDTASDGSKVGTVVGSCDYDGRRRAMAGTSPVNRDVHRAVAEAVASAFVALP
jgi:hypothetical protein